jgi:hypothetical protein
MMSALLEVSERSGTRVGALQVTVLWASESKAIAVRILLFSTSVCRQKFATCVQSDWYRSYSIWCKLVNEQFDLYMSLKLAGAILGQPAHS